jgi:hypothetical protein
MAQVVDKVKDNKRWYLLTTDPNIQDEFNRYVIVEDSGDEIFRPDKTPFTPAEYEYRTFMVHQMKGNVQGFPDGDWVEHDRFEITRHLIVGHYEKMEDNSGDEGVMVTGWKADKIVIFSEAPKFLQWDSVEMPDEFVSAEDKVKSMVVRDLEAEQAALSQS